MYIKSLIIKKDNGIIREIKFHKGLNLIVDETPDRNTDTGNNVGKTTILRLIDFCLGKDRDSIYKDPENKKEINNVVKNFLINNKVSVELTLVDDLDNASESIVIKRNFLTRNNRIYLIGSEDVPQKEEDSKLMNAIFPSVTIDKPTFRQIIAHNIRYENHRISNTIKVLDNYTTDEEYESLYLYLFGCDFENGAQKQELMLNLQKEENFKKRLEREQPKNSYITAIEFNQNEIDKLEERKRSLNLNPVMENDMKQLNSVKMNINRIASDITNLKIRKDIILDTKTYFLKQKFDKEVEKLRQIYDQAKVMMPQLHKSFEDLVRYHNKMLDNKVSFFTEELPELENTIASKEKELAKYRRQEKELSERITCSDTFEDLDIIIKSLNQLYESKGKYESIVEQIEVIESNIKDLNYKLSIIQDELYSENFENKVKFQLSKFNRIFSDVSEELYSQKFALTHYITEKRGKKIYKFLTFDPHFSSGIKQGEISCFDIAYILFADQNNIPCLHFLLNDKKELMHDNQLVKIAELAERENIQFVASILKDKLPEELQKEDYYIIKLSQKDKLFRIEG